MLDTNKRGAMRRRTVLQATAGAAIVGTTGYASAVSPSEDDDATKFRRDDSPVRFSPAIRNADPLKVGIVSDVHWRDEPRPQHIVSKEVAKENLRTAATELNEWGADFVVQQGDLADGCCSRAERPPSAIRRGIREAKAFLDDVLNAPVHHVLGNHEYMWPNADIERTYSIYGWDRLEDTFYTVKRKGITFAVLNSAYTETNRKQSATDHRIPRECLCWLRDVVAETDGPLFSVSHVPLTGGDGTRYDSTRGAAAALDHLHSAPVYVGGFFGHSHHAPNWKRVRVQTDSRGSPHVHTCSPNYFAEGDAVRHSRSSERIVPFTKVAISSAGWQVIASYADWDVRTSSNWRYETNALRSLWRDDRSSDAADWVRSGEQLRPL